MNNTIVILGNGFDIDLGWKTSYKDFLTSDKFSIMGKPRYVMKYTNKLFQRMGDNWYDLEGFMRECIEKATEEELDVLNDFWNICRDKIYDYLTPKGDKQQQIFKTNTNSCAYLFLQKISDAKVFSFNYTLPYVLTQLPEHEIVYMHGALEDGFSWSDIKLGIDLHVKNKLAWTDKLKPYLKAYGNDKKDALMAAVKNAENIVIYGHSMSITDSDYFEPMFSNIIDAAMSRKNIFFITKNTFSMQCLKDNLSSYGIDYDKLFFASNECKCVFTDNGISNTDYQGIIALI